MEMAMRLARLAGVLTSAAVIACEHPLGPTQAADPRLQRTALSEDDQEESRVRGAGQYDLNGLIVTFAFDAESETRQEAKGKFAIYADEGGGLTVNFEARVTCLSIDPVNHRAWIGGRVKQNRSTDPALQGAIHQTGRDIWFRVLDDPNGDRSTFTGFEGSAGFLTSADYCAGQPWPAGNARTWPVMSGGITIRP
jgi:hypothetical protein